MWLVAVLSQPFHFHFQLIINFNLNLNLAAYSGLRLRETTSSRASIKSILIITSLTLRSLIYLY